MRPIQVIVLAAGKGTRMRSRTPKVLHQVGGRPMLEHVLRAAAHAISSPAAAPENEIVATSAPSRSPSHFRGGGQGERSAAISATASAASHASTGEGSDTSRYDVVVGHEAEQVRAAIHWTPPQGTLRFVTQEEQLGTGHAVGCAEPDLAAGETAPATVLVLYGDTPLVTSTTLRRIVEEHDATGATLTFLTAHTHEPNDYGRVLRDESGRVRGIVEVKHATRDELAIPEVNSGIYCFDAAWLWSRLDGLERHPNGEIYLTDLVEVAVREGAPLATVSAPLEETLGVNDRVALAEAERILHDRILRELMLSGVTVQDPASTYVESGVRVGQDTILLPGTMLRGETVVGERCTVGPSSVVVDSHIGDECIVAASWVERSVMEPRSQIGPMSHLRPGARISSGAKLGNYAEVKNSTIGPGVQMHHFSYIGDATIGARTNIAAGTITANFAPDGTKRRTEVGEGAFIGCDTILVAPVTVGEAARTGAGAIVTRDVPPAKLAVGMPARVVQPRTASAPHSTEPARKAQTEDTPSDAASATSPAREHPPQSGAAAGPEERE